MQAGGMKTRRYEVICRQEERRTGDREEFAERKKAGQQTERNMQEGRKESSR